MNADLVISKNRMRSKLENKYKIIEIYGNCVYGRDMLSEGRCLRHERRKMRYQGCCLIWLQLLT